MVWTRAGVVRTAVVRVAAAPAVVVVMVALVAVGCSDDEPEPKPGPVETSSVDGPSPGPTPSTATATTPGADGGTPVPPPEMDRVDEAGAEAFAKHYFALVNHAQATGELEALEAVSSAECAACQGGIDALRKNAAAGHVLKGGEYRVLRAKASPMRPSSFNVVVWLESTPQQVISATGEVVRTHDGGPVELVMTVHGQPETSWLVLKWDFR